MSHRAVRGSVLHFLSDPTSSDDEAAYEYLEDGLLLIHGGRIARIGPARELLKTLPADEVVEDYSGKLILPGFIDTHIHFVQTDIIASYGRRLLEWLQDYTFPAEREFATEAHAREVAEFFLQELLRNGTTTALIMGSVHKTSVNAIFEAALRRDMRVIAGKVLMDRNCPVYLRDTPGTAYVDSRALIESWHKRARLQYAISPRFAPTSSLEQLAVAGQLAREHTDVYVHSHLSENQEEVGWVKELYPDQRSYLEVYASHGLLRKRCTMAHGIWLDEADLELLARTGAAVSHCPTCNLFMGSGLFDLRRALDAGVSVGLGTDVGGGTTFSMLRVLHEAYKVAQLVGYSLSPLRAFYLATLGAARTLDLDDRIGNFQVGKEADFVVLDPAATPLLARRASGARSIKELLFVLMMLGDDRAVAGTYLLGSVAHRRDLL